MEDFSPLYNENIDYSALYDNVRGLVLNSKYNPNIFKSLKDNPNKFFLFNNGITITTSDIIAESVNAGQKVKLTVNDLQVLNGGQTLRTIHNFNKADSDHINNHLSKAEILVRIFKTGTSSELNNKIVEFTNSQNAISPSDLKSLSSEQIQIEQLLDEHDIIYARKTGDTGTDLSRPYRFKISMEKFGQLLLAKSGEPQKATNQKKKIFDKYYHSLFGNGNFQIDESPQLIEEYFAIKSEYQSSPYTTSEQKIFFVAYLKTKLNEAYSDLIEKLEVALAEYEPESGTTSEARKLLQLKFKEFLESKYAIDQSDEEE